MRTLPALILALHAALLPVGAASDEDAVHPGYDLLPARPAGFEPRVSGLELLPGGRLAVATWSPNEVHILAGADGPAEKMTARKAATGFSDIMGLCAAGDTIFVVDQHRVYRLDDKDGNGLPETKTVVGQLPYSGSFHEWSFGLVRKDGRLYTALSVATTRTGRTLVPQKEPKRGSLVAMDAQGALEVIAGGLRAAEGIGLGPGGDLFLTDNQGSWLPASKLIHAVKGRTYGHRVEPPGIYDSLFPSPPAVWLPYGETSKSPTQPVLMAAGPHAGQMVYGDVASGAARRVFLEKVAGEWQGAVLKFSGGFEAAAHRLAAGPDGSLWVGGLGNGDQMNWGWRGRRFGLQRMRPNGREVFEVKAARAVAGGFEIEFSAKPGPSALSPASYSAKRWWYEPTAQYGGPKKDLAPCPVKSVKASADGMRVFLALDGLQLYHVIHVRLPGVKSASGGEIWTPEFWYTLNNLSEAGFRP